jgi:predicted transcriptional regulator
MLLIQVICEHTIGREAHIGRAMTKLLEDALEQLRKLPEADQDEAADFLLNFMARRDEPEELDEETLAAIEEGLAQADRGEVFSEEEMAEFFRRRGA